MARDEVYRERIRNKARLAGVPPDMFVSLYETEGNRPNIGLHGTRSTAAGAFGLTEPFAKQYGATNRFDPEQNADAALRGLVDAHEHWGNWPQAFEEFKMGRRHVGDAEFRRAHPGEWAAAQKVAGAGMGTLYPGRSEFDPTTAAVRDQTDTLRGDVDSAQSELTGAMGQPFNLPRTPVMQERNALQVGIPSLFSNIASAISGNPLYQQSQMAEFAQEDASREQARATNLGMSRQEVMQRRTEGLTAIANKLEYAQKRLEAAGEHEQALKLQNEHMKALEHIQKLHDQAEKERVDAQIAGDLDKEYARLGLLRDEQGNLVPNTALSKLSGLMEENEVQQRIGAINALLSDKKRDKKDDQTLIDQRNQLQYTTVRKGQTWESVKGMVAQGYPDKKEQAQILEAIAHRHPELGASYLTAIDDARGKVAPSWGQHMQSGPVPLEGQRQTVITPKTTEAKEDVYAPHSLHTRTPTEHEKMAEDLVSRYGSWDELSAGIPPQYMKKLGYDVAILRAEFTRKKREQAEEIANARREKVGSKL